MKKKPGQKAKKEKPKMSGVDDANLNYEVETAYTEVYGIYFDVHPREAVFADMLP